MAKGSVALAVIGGVMVAAAVVALAERRAHRCILAIEPGLAATGTVDGHPASAGSEHPGRRRNAVTRTVGPPCDGGPRSKRHSRWRAFAKRPSAIQRGRSPWRAKAIGVSPTAPTRLNVRRS